MWSGKTMGEKRVLLVDDDVELTDILHDYLEDKGLQVTEAGSARQALYLLKHSGPYDLVMLDIGLPEMNVLAYTQMHAAVWPGVLAALDKVNIRNYSIYLGQIKPGAYLLFSYFEYVGDDFQRDMAAMGDEVTKLWWTYTDPLKTRLPGTPEGQQWKTMGEVFHTN